MSEQYFTVNIRAYLDKDKLTYIGEDSLYEGDALMKKSKKFMPLIFTAMCSLIVLLVVHFAPMPHQLWGTYSTGNGPVRDSLYLVLQADGKYTVYKQFEILAQGTFEPVPLGMGSEDIIYRFISGEALAETKLVYDKEADAVALLNYRGEDIPMSRISENAVFINVNAE